MDEWVTTREASTKVGLTQHRIAQLAREGVIEAHRVGKKKWLVKIRSRNGRHELVTPEESGEIHQRSQIRASKQSDWDRHFGDLAETARKFSINLERSSPSEIYPEYIAHDRRDTQELENIDDYLGKCLLSHLKAEFPQLFDMEIWQEIYHHNNKRELYNKLVLVAHRKTFGGTCDICKDWQQ